jgi:hypothetical protein
MTQFFVGPSPGAGTVELIVMAAVLFVAIGLIASIGAGAMLGGEAAELGVEVIIVEALGRRCHTKDGV